MQANDYQPLSLVDNFWLRQDRLYNHMTISSVFILEDKVGLESLKETIETRWVLPYKRFQQRPVYHLRGVYLVPDEPQTRFRGKLGVAKRVAWVESLPLDEVKTIGMAHGCTINDVLLATSSSTCC